MITVLIIGAGSLENEKDIALASRAFGASSVIFTSRKNNKLVNYFKSVNRQWGGRFEIRFERDWERVLEEKKRYEKIYLTKSGAPIGKMMYRIRTYKNILLIATLAENLKKLDGMIDYNVSVTTQPHSSVSAIAVFLHMFFSGRELAVRFNNARSKIVQEKVR